MRVVGSGTKFDWVWNEKPVEPVDGQQPLPFDADLDGDDDS